MPKVRGGSKRLRLPALEHGQSAPPKNHLYFPSYQKSPHFSKQQGESITNNLIPLTALLLPLPGTSQRTKFWLSRSNSARQLHKARHRIASPRSRSPRDRAGTAIINTTSLIHLEKYFKFLMGTSGPEVRAGLGVLPAC